MSRDGLTRDGRYRMTLRSRVRYGPAATRVRNWRFARDARRGRTDMLRRAGDQVRSRMPVYRNLASPATGRPHRTDAEFGRGIDRALARARDARAQDPRPRGRVPR